MSVSDWDKPTWRERDERPFMPSALEREYEREIAALKARIAELEARIPDPETLETALEALENQEGFYGSGWEQAPARVFAHALEATEHFRKARAKLEALRK